jgi:hypothetical protein
MNLNAILQHLFLELFLPSLLVNKIESFDPGYKPNTNCWIRIFDLLPLDLIKLWTQIQNLSEHNQSKSLALGHCDGMLELFEGNPVMSGAEEVQRRVQEFLHFEECLVLDWNHQFVTHLQQLLLSDIANSLQS